MGKNGAAFELSIQRVIRKKLCRQENGPMDIVVRFRKRWMIFLIGILLLLVFLFGVLPSVMRSTFLFDHSMLEIFSIPLLFYGFPLLWQVFHALFLHQPALSSSSTGIEVLPLNVPGRFFIRWSEIQRISVDQYFANKYLCIHPKESSEYTASFSGFTRFITLPHSKEDSVFIPCAEACCN
jgi:hypothetical protein